MTEGSLNSDKKLTRTNAAQVYVSFFAYTFDILSFISIIFVISAISKQIYPSANFGVSLLVTWGGVAAGAVTRPLGVAYFGPYADRKGRKQMLYVTIIGSAVFTGALAGIPTYAQVGFWSPVIYVSLRLISGIFIGGLIAGGLVFATENLPEKFRGVLTGFTESGGSWAHAIGSSWLLLISLAISAASFAAFGWRIMFLVALLPLVMVLPVLYRIPESDIYKATKSRGRIRGQPLRRLLSVKTLRRVFGLSVISSIGLLGFVQLTENTFPSFLIIINHASHPVVATIILVGAFIGIAGSIVGGAISQVVGRRVVAIVIGVAMVLMSYLFVVLGDLPGTSFGTIVMVLAPFYFLLGIGLANQSIRLNEMFPTDVRASGVGMNWNLGFGLAGVWPLIVSAFLAVYGLKVYPMVEFITILIFAIIFVASSVFIKETRGNISEEWDALNTNASADRPYMGEDEPVSKASEN